MFIKKKRLLDAEETIRRLEEKLDWHERHYEKQQIYIEQLYDLIAEMSLQLGRVLKVENLPKLQANPYAEDNKDFFLDLSLLFATKLKKGHNVTCYFGKDLVEIRKKFQDRDFKNVKIAHMLERLSVQDLHIVLKEIMWKKSLDDGMSVLRKQKGLD